MEITRSRLDRMLFIDACIRKGGYPNANRIAGEWAERTGDGVPVDRKTIQRDIDYLRDVHHAPIEFSHPENGFYYSEPTWKLPFGMHLTEGEFLALILAKQIRGAYENTPIFGYLNSLFDKIRNSLGGPADIDPSLLDDRISFHNHLARPIDPTVWTAILTAINNKTVLQITYFDSDDEQASEREVEPFHMANVDNDWYMVGHSRKTDARRHFSISKIHAAIPTDKEFSPHDDFDADEYFANRFGMSIAQPGASVYNVVLFFTASAAPRVLERVWHPQQELKQGKSGAITLRLPMPSLAEAKRFCLGWGKEVKVFEPQELQQAMRREAADMFSSYNRGY